MGRRPRRELQTGWHHVVNRGVARQRVFFSDADRVEFGRLLGVGHRELGVEVLAYCLMDNHFHLVLQCDEGNLSSFMQQLGSVYTRHANDRIGRDGPLFRGRFFSNPILTESYLVRAVRYVHRNPLAISPPPALEAFRWSSHRTYCGHRAAPTWLRTDTVLGWFGGDRQAFHEFVADASVPGSAVDAADVAGAIATVVDATGLEGAPQGLARTIGLLVSERLGGTVADGIVADLGYGSPDSLRQAVRRAHRRASADPSLRACVDAVLDLAG